MTDVEAPPEQRAETVARVLGALSAGSTNGYIGPDALREILESEGQSLLDLPEVGLWLALSEGSLTGSPFDEQSVIIDLRDEAAPDPVVALVDAPGRGMSAAVEVTAIEVMAVESAVESADVTPVDVTPVELDEVPADAAPPTTWRSRRRSRRARRRRLPKIVTDTPPPNPSTWASASLPATKPPSTTDTPPALPGAATAGSGGIPGGVPPQLRWPFGLPDRIRSLTTHLETVLAEPIPFALDDPAAIGTVCIEHPVVDPSAVMAFVAPLRSHLERALTAPTFSLPDSAVAGSARPEPSWPPRMLRSIAALDVHLRTSLDRPLELHVPDPSTPGNAGLDPYWPPTLTAHLADLDGFLRSRFLLPTAPRVPASRLAGATNGAEPDPYWPRHLVRSGTAGLPVDDLADLPAAPRSSEELEADLQRAIDAVALIGEADLDSVAAETEISLARLVRREPLDRLGRIYPATLAAFLVRHTRLHPNPTDFDALLPIAALRRTNPVGLAFSEALVRLSKPVFREVEQRDEFDHRVRYLRRMQLHVGIPVDLAPAVLDATLAAHWSGARSGREVAQDWLSAHRAVTGTIGDATFRLLTRTDHGAQMLEALLELARWRGLEPTPNAPPDCVDPLPPGLVAAAWRWLSDRPLPVEEWGGVSRPRLRLGNGPGAGPEIELPLNSSRWLLNGELLAYGSPVHRKSVPLPLTRSGKWAITTGTSRRASPFDVGLQSAADDRTVLVFDESGRFHHHVLPLGGTTATVIAPAGSRIDGQSDRTLLVDRWIGFERIEVDLADRTEITVAERGRTPVTVQLDHRLGAHLIASETPDTVRRLPRLAFRGHVPSATEIEITVADGRSRHSSWLSDPRVDAEHGAFGFDHLLDDGPERTVALTVTRSGFEPAVHQVLVPAPIALPVPSAADPTAHPTAPATVEREIARPRTPPPSGARPRRGSTRPVRPSWVAPTVGVPADDALHALVHGLALALLGPVDTAEPGGTLSARAWDDALADDLERLVAWGLRHHRPLRQWRATTAALQNLDPLWSGCRHSDRGRVALPLLTAGLLSVMDGPHRDLAVRWFNEARLLAPQLADCVAQFAAAYLEVQRSHPESRFRPIRLT